MKRLLHEPLIHFLAIGALLFGFYRFTANPPAPETSNRITFGAGEIEQMRAIFMRQRQRPPTQDEMKGLLAARVHEEVLYREALAIGLDRDDTIIKRRLAQKFEFLVEDLSDPGRPTDAELAKFLSEHDERYRVPGRLSFAHIYFSAGKRGARVERDAQKDLVRLRGGVSTAAIEEMGDAFLLEHAYKHVTAQEIEKIFGPGFAAHLIKVPLREWHGPIASGYGLHLVRVEEHETPHAATLDAVREKVKKDWLDARRRQLKEAAFKKLRDRYEVVVDNNALHTAVIAQASSAQGSGQ